MTRSLPSKVAVLTGAASGIGRAAVEGLVARGADVLTVDVSRKVQAVAAEIAAGGGRVVGLEADDSELDQCEAYVAKANEEFGGMDFFFNNAGIHGGPTPIVDYDVDLFDRVMRANVRGVWPGLRAVLPAIIERGGGAIVNTCSNPSLRGYGNLSPYIASKHAVLGLTRVAAVEGAERRIRVNAVCPGVIDTPMVDEVRDGMGDDFASFVSRTPPMDRLGTAGEVADVVCYLLSEQHGGGHVGKRHWGSAGGPVHHGSATIVGSDGSDVNQPALDEPATCCEAVDPSFARSHRPKHLCRHAGGGLPTRRTPYGTGRSGSTCAGRSSGPARRAHAGAHTGGSEHGTPVDSRRPSWCADPMLNDAVRSTKVLTTRSGQPGGSFALLNLIWLRAFVADDRLGRRTGHGLLDHSPAAAT